MKVLVIRTILRFVVEIVVLFEVFFFFFGWLCNFYYFVTFPFHEEKRNNFMVYNILIENRNPRMYDIDTPFVSFYSQTLSEKTRD